MKKEILSQTEEVLESIKIGNNIDAGMGNVLVKKELIKQAIDALESCKVSHGLDARLDNIQMRDNTLIALKEAFEKPDRIPVAEIVHCPLVGAGMTKWDVMPPIGTKLYAE